VENKRVEQDFLAVSKDILIKLLVKCLFALLVIGGSFLVAFGTFVKAEVDKSTASNEKVGNLLVRFDYLVEDVALNTEGRDREGINFQKNSTKLDSLSFARFAADERILRLENNQTMIRESLAAIEANVESIKSFVQK
jgi:hypothetical protein